MVQKRGRAVINLNIYRNDFSYLQMANFYIVDSLASTCMLTIGQYLIVLYQERDDYGLESGLIMRKGFSRPFTCMMENFEFPKLRISSKMFLLSVVLSF